MPTTMKVAVLGSGNMGTALAQVIAKNGHQVRLWNYAGDSEPLEQIRKYGENKKFLPGVRLSKNIHPAGDLQAALRGAMLVYFVVPSRFVGNIVKQAAPFLSASAVCVDATKGMDEKSLGVITDIIAKNLPPKLRRSLATISGPAMAGDMARGQFTAMNIASRSTASARLVKKAMESDRLKLVYTRDILGVEVAGSFKNVYAIAMGLCDGLGLAMNTKAALLVQSLREMGLLIKKMGGQQGTIYGLAGLGDLVGTSLCAASRNRRFGENLARFGKAAKAAAAVGQTIEGIGASCILCMLGKKYRVPLPFAEMIQKVVSEKIGPRQAVDNFLKNLE